MKKHTILALAAIFLCTGLYLPVPPVVSAEELKLEVSDPTAMKSALEKLTGKSVVLKLAGGEEVSGVVEAVGPAAVRIGQLTGKEFYSAVVLLDRVSAVIYRAR